MASSPRPIALAYASRAVHRAKNARQRSGAGIPARRGLLPAAASAPKAQAPTPPRDSREQLFEGGGDPLNVPRDDLVVVAGDAERVDARDERGPAVARVAGAPGPLGLRPEHDDA